MVDDAPLGVVVVRQFGFDILFLFLKKMFFFRLYNTKQKMVYCAECNKDAKDETEIEEMKSCLYNGCAVFVCKSCYNNRLVSDYYCKEHMRRKRKREDAVDDLIKHLKDAREKDTEIFDESEIMAMKKLTRYKLSELYMCSYCSRLTPDCDQLAHNKWGETSMYCRKCISTCKYCHEQYAPELSYKHADCSAYHKNGMESEDEE